MLFLTRTLFAGTLLAYCAVTTSCQPPPPKETLLEYRLDDGSFAVYLDGARVGEDLLAVARGLPDGEGKPMSIRSQIKLVPNVSNAVVRELRSKDYQLQAFIVPVSFGDGSEDELPLILKELAK